MGKGVETEAKLVSQLAYSGTAVFFIDHRPTIAFSLLALAVYTGLRFQRRSVDPMKAGNWVAPPDSDGAAVCEGRHYHYYLRKLH